jgi:hypothetical protein
MVTRDARVDNVNRITRTKMNTQGRGCMQDYVEGLRILGAGPGWCRPIHKCQLQLILPELEVVQATASVANYGMPEAAFPKINRLVAGMERNECYLGMPGVNNSDRSMVI